MASPKDSEAALHDNHERKISLAVPLKYSSNMRMDVNPDIIENILLDMQPAKILEQNRELETFKDFYEDFENERYDF